MPPFIATRLIRSMVTSNPSPAYVARVSAAFINNGGGVRGDLAAVVRAVLLDPEALNPSMVEHGRLKDPVLHVIGFGRALGATISDPASFQNVFSNLSQRVLTPATVFSFYPPTALIPGQTTYFGPEFQLYPPALAIQRANFIYGIITGQYGSAYAIDRAPFQAAAGDPAALVDMVNQRLMMGRMSSQLRQVLITATAAVPASDPSQRAIGAIYLAAISSEYTVYGGGFSAGGVIPTNVQSPTGFTAAYINGNMLTLRWTPPEIGPAPTGYLLEGGLSPGAMIASLPTGSPAAQFTFAAPSGSYYLRLRAMSGAQMSLPSNEIRVYVNVPQRPSPPTNFQAAVKGVDTVARLAQHLRRRRTDGAGDGRHRRGHHHHGAALRRGVHGAGDADRHLHAALASPERRRGQQPVVVGDGDLAQQHLRVATGAVELRRHQCGQHRRHVVGAAVGRHAGARLPPDRHRVVQRRVPDHRPGLRGGGAAGHLQPESALGECLWRPVRALPSRPS